MEETWIGKAVSIQCNETLGIFQGTIKDLSSTQLTIVRAFRNGVPLRKQNAEITLSIADIVNLELIPHYNAQTNGSIALVNNPTSVKQPNFPNAGLQAVASTSRESALTHKMANMKLNGVHRPIPLPAEQKVINGKLSQQQQQLNKSPTSSSVANFFNNLIPATVEVQLARSLSTSQTEHPHTSSNGHSSSKPIDIVNSARSVPSNGGNWQNQDRRKTRRGEGRSNGNGTGNYTNGHGRDQRDQTFGTPVDDPSLHKDFDFEENLKLFDKQAIWDEIEARQKPDVVRQALNSSRQKYRHDENVIHSLPTQYRQIESDCQSTHEFVTDEGLIIPAIPRLVRTQIQSLADRNGLSWERQCDILARGTSDLAILLLGGARRLNPNNEHQWPRIAIICDKKSEYAKTYEIAAATGRQLASHGLKVILYIKDEDFNKGCIELKLFKATGNRVVSSLNDMPSCDLVILSLASDVLSSKVKKWILDNRSSVLAIDPPPNGISNVQIKCSILPVLPLNNTSISCGKLYLCNLSIPDKYFTESGITYKSPFGHKFVIPIHMKD